MNSQLKNMLIGAAIGAVAVVVIEVVFSLSIFISFGVGAAIGIVGFIVLNAMAKGEDPVTAVREEVSRAAETIREPDTRTRERQANEQLHAASLVFVTSGAAPALVEPLREIVESLRALVARALEFAPQSETTFNLTKLASEDLPLIVGQFIDLSPADREAKQSELAEKFHSLTQKVGELTGFIDQGRVSDFEAQAMFINLKFGT